MPLAAPHYGDRACCCSRRGPRPHRERAGSYFAPGWSALSRRLRAGLLADAGPRSLAALRPDATARRRHLRGPGDELRRLGEIFATIVVPRARSPPRAPGRRPAGPLSGRRAGLRCRPLRPARDRRCSDLGKLRVPDEVLDKPGRLDARRRKIINAHSFETFRILRGIQGFEGRSPCGPPATTGSPTAAATPSTSMPPRLPWSPASCASLTSFQAMVQARPYQAGMDDAAVARFFSPTWWRTATADRSGGRTARRPARARRQACPGAAPLPATVVKPPSEAPIASPVAKAAPRSSLEASSASGTTRARIASGSGRGCTISGGADLARAPASGDAGELPGGVAAVAARARQDRGGGR